MDRLPPLSGQALTETRRRAELLNRTLRALFVLGAVAAISSLFDERNELVTTGIFYGAIFVWIGVVWVLVKSNRVMVAAWAVSGFFWVLIATVTVLFGGMQGQFASVFAVAVLLIGAVVGARPALFMASLSTLWCSGIVYAELEGWLPEPLVSYSPINAWGAVTGTVLLTSVLLRESLDSMRVVNEQAQRLAQERDEALRRSILGQKMELVGNLTSGIAHDFNNLLSVVSSSSAVLRPQLPEGNEEAICAIDDLDEATNRAAVMTRQLLSLGRSKVGDPETLDLADLVRRLSKMLPRLLGPKIRVELNCSEGAWIRGSRVGIEQIVLNLAVNARDAMPAGGPLDLEVLERGDDVVLTVSDRGLGISPEIREQIFEPFYSTKATGTGLGLSTVMHQVQQHDARIEVSSGMGTGTRFEVSFRRVSAPQGTAFPSSCDEGAPGSVQATDGRLLLVEDEPLVRRATARLLRQAGYEVVELADGQEALGLAAESYDLVCVVTDISMPRMDGEELARRLFEIHPRLPVVMMSGNREPNPELLQRPSCRYLSKPLQQEQLLSTVRQLVGSRSDSE